jgi:hypothetical protein
MASREFARKLVNDIGKKHGYIRKEVLDRMSDADRREVEHAMLMKDQLIASSVTTYDVPAIGREMPAKLIDDCLGWHVIYTRQVQDLSSKCSRTQMTTTIPKLESATRCRKCHLASILTE